MGRKLTTSIFKDRSIKIHGDRYGYSKVKYVNNHSKVKIICEKHGLFEQIPKDHLNGFNCSKCGRGSYDENEYISKCEEIINIV